MRPSAVQANAWKRERVYRVVTHVEGGRRKPRVHVMRYVGTDYAGRLAFDARPAAGNVSLPHEIIVGATEVSHKTKRVVDRIKR